MKKYIVFLTILIVSSLFFSACISSVSKTSAGGEDMGTESNSLPTESSSMLSDTDETVNRFPASFTPIPDSYLSKAEQQGTLQDLYYDIYESFSYEEKSQKLRKHAVVYLPYGYDESKKYPVFYLMHGGWSNESVYLGSPDESQRMKHILNHGIANDDIQPVIVVCPTYNNTSSEDSGDYSLAIRLTDNYHNELINDLIPVVEGKYSTYAEDTTFEAIAASRDYRTFCGFSMGSMETWRTFEHSLDYFRYFMPSNGGPAASIKTYESIVQNSGHD
jgi:enterochelin esterase-like enzyme